MNVNIVGVAVLCVLVTLICLMLRSVRPELAAAAAVTASVILTLYLLTCASPITALISSLMAQTAVPSEFIRAVLKALGVCLITGFASESCTDAGQSALAAKVELAGRIAIVILCIPMLKEIISLIRSLLP